MALFCSLIVVAQEVTVTPVFNGNSVQSAGVYYSVVGARISPNVAVNTPYKISDVKLTVKRDGAVILNNHPNAPFDAADAGLYELSGNVTLTWTENGATKTKSVAVPVTKIQIINPKLTLQKNAYVVVSDEPFGVDFVSGTTLGSWEIDWTVVPDGANVEGNALNFTFSQINNSDEIAWPLYTADCKYYVAGTELYSKQENVTAMVYPAPKFNYLDSKSVFNTAKDTTITMGFSVAGAYPDGWTYQWFKDGEAITAQESGNADVQPFEIPAIQTNSFTQRFEDWVSTNKGLNGVSSKHSYTFEAYSGDVLTFDWRVSSEDGYDWLKITLDGRQLYYKSGVAEGRHSETITTEGEHTLEVEYIKDNGVGGNEDCGEIKNMLLETKKRRYVYKVVAQNHYTDGRDWGTFEKEFVVNVYPTTSIEYVSDSVYNFSQESTFTLEIATAGGMQDGWRYSWKKNGELLDSEEPSFEFTATPEEQFFVDRYEVIAVNYAENHDILAQYRKEFIVNVFPVPTVDVPKAYFNYLELDTTINLEFAKKGGFPHGWDVTWKKNGVEMTSTAPAAVHTNSYGVKTNTIYYISQPYHDKGVATSWCVADGGNSLISNVQLETVANAFDVRQQFAFISNDNGATYYLYHVTEQKYVNKEGSLDEQPIDPIYFKDAAYANTVFIYFDEQHQINVNSLRHVVVDNFGTPDGGNSCFLEEVGSLNVNDQNIEVALTPTGMPVEDVYVAHVTNTFYGNVWFDKEFHFYVNTYPHPAIEYTTASEFYTANDTIFQLGVQVAGAREQGWIYKWIKNGSVVAEDANNTFDAEVAPSESDYSNVYTVIATNKTMNGDTLTVLEREFVVNVYREASIKHKNDRRVFNYAKETDVTLEFEISGGYSEGWTYVWHRNGELLDESGKQITYREVPTNKLFTSEYSVVATNTALNGDTLAVCPISFDVNIFPLTSIEYTTETEFNTAKNETFVLGVQVAGGREAGWEYKWSKNDLIIDGDEPTLNAVEKTTKNIQNNTYKVVATNLAENGDLLAEYTKEFVVNVYIAPDFFETKKFHEQVVGGIEFDRSVNHTGGYPDGWELIWKRNDRDLHFDGKEYQFTEENPNDEGYILVKYTVQAINRFENVVWYDSIIDFPVRVYPQITFENTETPGSYDLYNETLDLGANYYGGVVDGDKGSWTFDWTKNGARMNCDEPVFTHNAKTNNSGSIINDVYKVVAKHFIGGDEVWKKEFTYNIATYPLAKIKDVTGQDTTICGGNNVKFAIDVKYADVKGWSYKWTRDGVTVAGNNTTELSVKEDNNSENNSVTHTYVLTATNKHNGKTWVEETYTFVSTIRPKLIVPVMQEYEKMLREGDFIELAVSDGRGGYPQGWQYTWYNSHDFTNCITDQNAAALDEFTDIEGYNDQKMHSRPEKYMLVVQNVDVNNNTPVHYADTIYFEVTMHRCPQEPFALTKKGNGSSNILIVDMLNEKGNSGLKNETLVDNDYKFAFGYDADKEISRTDYTLRYQTYTKDQINKDPWVYAYWEYDDGYVCKTDKVYLGSRAVSDDITEDVIVLDNSGFKATLMEPMPASVRVITFNGAVVKQTTYSEQVEFDEKFDLTGLNGGMYIVEVCIGNNREVNKIFIK